jgi:DNA polymerase-3 subunit delta'
VVGPAEVGKRTLALQFAQALNCESRAACGECRACRRIARGSFTDLMVVDLLEAEESEPATKNIKIEQIRALEEWTSLACYEGRYKVAIVDGAELMSAAAQNAFLKTLEEPPAHVVLLLITLDDRLLLPTVRSRCQRVTLRAVPAPVIARGLREGRGLDEARAEAIARAARGRPGWALRAAGDPSLLEERTQALAELRRIAAGGVSERFTVAAEWANLFRKRRRRVEEILLLWSEWWRDLLVVRYDRPELVTSAELTRELVAEAGAYSPAQIVRAIRQIEEAIQHLRENVNPRLALEALMLRIPA